MEKLVSIIVPVYKVEEYLAACVESVLAQTYRHLEVILVDDGSPDGCGAICDRYAQMDGRVKVIHKTNGGLSDARNAGMAIATGEFLMFVDSDDLLTADAVQTLLELALKENAELVIGGHDRFEDVPKPAAQEWPRHEVLSPVEAMADMFRNGCAAWARIYRRQIHEDILYPVGRINEDEAIVLQILERCTQVVKTEKIVYRYRCRPESITTSRFTSKKMHWPEHCGANLQTVREKWPELEQLAAARYRSSLLWTLSEIALSEEAFPDEVEAAVAQLRQHRKLFRKVPFQFRQDRIRMELLIRLPCGLYKRSLRLKRGV